MKTCNCCGEAVSEAVVVDGGTFCSFECVEFIQEQEQECLDSYLVGEEDTSGEYVSLYK